MAQSGEVLFLYKQLCCWKAVEKPQRQRIFVLPQRGRVNKQLASCLNYGARFTCDYEGAFDGECQQKRNFQKNV